MTDAAVKTGRPRAPSGLAAAGKRLWTSIQGDLPADWELDARECGHLERACHIADRIAALDAEVRRDGVTVSGSRGQTVVHPAVAEIRQLELVRLRLLSAIEVVDPQEAKRSATPAQARGRRAAGVRWDLERKRRGQAG
jgi:phage terminase small subunit